MKTLLAITHIIFLSTRLVGQSMLITFPNNLGSLQISEDYNIMGSNSNDIMYVDEYSPVYAIEVRGFRPDIKIKHPQVSNDILQLVSSTTLSYLKSSNPGIYISAKEFVKISPQLDAIVMVFKGGKAFNDEPYVIQVYEFIDSYINYHPMSLHFYYGLNTPYDLVNTIIADIIKSIQINRE